MDPRLMQVKISEDVSAIALETTLVDLYVGHKVVVEVYNGRRTS